MYNYSYTILVKTYRIYGRFVQNNICKLQNHSTTYKNFETFIPHLISNFVIDFLFTIGYISVKNGLLNFS